MSRNDDGLEELAVLGWDNKEEEIILVEGSQEKFDEMMNEFAFSEDSPPRQLTVEDGKEFFDRLPYRFHGSRFWVTKPFEYSKT